MSFAQDSENYFNDRFEVAANSSVDARASFLTKTYLHLAGAVIAFVVLSAALLQTSLPIIMLQAMAGSRLTWLLILGGFIVVANIARTMARSAQSQAGQYGALLLYVVGEAIIFTPLLYIAQANYEGVIAQAALATMGIFGGLTAVVFFTRKDFSFLSGILGLATIGFLVFIVLGAIFGFTGGIFLSVFGIVLASGYILFDTSRVLHNFRVGEHVAASLELFASVAFLFWYVLRFFMQSRN